MAPPKRGEKTTFTVKKKKRPADSKGKPPAPGERKAMRKRIVISNTNALEVHGLQELSVEDLANPELQGTVVSIPNQVVDKLRAIEAFKTTQSWGLFKRPSMLVRPETTDLGTMFEHLSMVEEEGKTTRKIIVGEKGSGKSFHLLQAMVMAFLKDWVVIHIPEGLHISSSIIVTNL